MKLIKYLLLIILILVSCSKDDNPVEPIEVTDQQIIEYFNYELGDVANFKSVISDKQNNPLFEAERKSTLSSQTQINSKQYFVFTEKMKIDSSTNSNETFLNFDGGTLKQLVDTAGAALLIPDSLKGTLEIELSDASTVFKYPINAGDNWDVFLGNIVMSTYKINVISITANYVGIEQIDLGANYGTVGAEKVSYTILLNFPDMNNPFLPNKQYYYADLWFSKGLGLIKISGSKFFTNFLVGGDINMNDTLYLENQIRY